MSVCKDIDDDDNNNNNSNTINSRRDDDDYVRSECVECEECGVDVFAGLPAP